MLLALDRFHDFNRNLLLLPFVIAFKTTGTDAIHFLMRTMTRWLKSVSLNSRRLR